MVSITLLSQGCVFEVAPSVGRVGGKYIPRTGEGTKSFQSPGTSLWVNQQSRPLNDLLQQYPSNCPIYTYWVTVSIVWMEHLTLLQIQRWLWGHRLTFWWFNYKAIRIMVSGSDTVSYAFGKSLNHLSSVPLSLSFSLSLFPNAGDIWKYQDIYLKFYLNS